MNELLEYVVVEHEVMLVGWENKVLQPDYGKSYDVSMIFREEVASVRRRYRKKELTIEEFNSVLRDIVATLEEDYPEKFKIKVRDGLGWYSKKLLTNLYMDSRLTLDGIKQTDIRELHLKEFNERKLRHARASEIEKERETLEILERIETERVAEKGRVPVVVGMKFSNKAGVLHAFMEVIASRLESKGIRSNQKNKEAELLTVVTAGWSTNHWNIVEVLVEGGRAWERDLRVEEK